MKNKLPSSSVCLFLLWASIQWGCEKRSFPVNPPGDTYPYIPPSDVGILAAQGGDRSATLTWSDPPEENITGIEVTNLNDHTVQSVPPGEQTLTLNGLDNFTEYTFLVRAKNSEDLYSVGVRISTYPFLPDQVPPAEVQNVIAFAGTTPQEAILVFTPSPDVDYSHAIAYFNRSETAASSRKGNLIKLHTEQEGGLTGILVKACDFSGNESAGVPVGKPETPLVTLGGGDEETLARLRWQLHPAATFVAGYRVAWGNDNAHTATLPPTQSEYTLPLGEMEDNPQITLSVTDASGLVLGNYTLLLDGRSIPGTVKCDAAATYSGVVIRGDGGFGNVDNNSWAEYELNVREEGSYQVAVYTSGPSPSTVKIEEAGQPLVSISTQPSGNWDQFNKQELSPEFRLTAGKHTLKFIFGSGQNILKYYFVRKQ